MLYTKRCWWLCCETGTMSRALEQPLSHMIRNGRKIPRMKIPRNLETIRWHQIQCPVYIFGIHRGNCEMSSLGDIFRATLLQIVLLGRHCLYWLLMKLKKDFHVQSKLTAHIIALWWNRWTTSNHRFKRSDGLAPGVHNDFVLGDVPSIISRFWKSRYETKFPLSC